jgi:hypothetical protein
MPDDQTTDEFGRTEADYAASKAGNAMLMRARDSVASRPLGLLTGAVQPADEAERLSRALTDAEAAHRSGNADQVHLAEFNLEQAIAASEESRRPRNADGSFMSDSEIDAATGFGGGPRGRGGIAPAAGSRVPLHPNALFREFVQSSKEANRELGRERPLSELTGGR